MRESEEDCILYLSTYPPRECGIATFTRDLSDAIDRRISPLVKSRIFAMNSNGVNIYNYPKKVVYQISDTDMNDYIEAAKKINASKSIKLVSIQHEFGIFGIDYGIIRQRLLIGQNIMGNLRSEDLDDFLDGLSGGMGCSLIINLKKLLKPEDFWVAVFAGAGEALREAFEPNPYRKGVPPGVKANLA